MAKYPWQSPYVSFNNNPVYWTDPFGDDPPKKQNWAKRAGRWLIGNSYITRAKDYAHKNGIDEKNISINRSLQTAVVGEWKTRGVALTDKEGNAIGQIEQYEELTFFTNEKQQNRIYDPESIETTSNGVEVKSSITDGMQRDATLGDYTFNSDKSGLVFNWNGFTTEPKYLGGVAPGLTLKNPAGAIYTARRISGGLKIGRQISQKRAILRLQKGKNIYTQNRNTAKTIMKKAGGKGKVIEDPAHGVGYFRHFHDKFRKLKGHSFFGKPN